jgi:dihydroneopterin aldolase
MMAAPPSSSPATEPMADEAAGLCHVFIRDLILACSIGAHRHERDSAQRVRINMDLAVLETPSALDDRLENVFSYEHLADGARTLATGGHINLVETFAERLAELCLTDVRVRRARIRVEKLDVYADAGAVGVEIERVNPRDPG